MKILQHVPGYVYMSFQTEVWILYLGNKVCTYLGM
jgi:hypothetical protein